MRLHIGTTSRSLSVNAGAANRSVSNSFLSSSARRSALRNAAAIRQASRSASAAVSSFVSCTIASAVASSVPGGGANVAQSIVAENASSTLREYPAGVSRALNSRRKWLYRASLVVVIMPASFELIPGSVRRPLSALQRTTDNGYALCLVRRSQADLSCP
jgi:hypothetical protein